LVTITNPEARDGEEFDKAVKERCAVDELLLFDQLNVSIVEVAASLNRREAELVERAPGLRVAVLRIRQK
jgi:hypothetical protein